MIHLDFCKIFSLNSAISFSFLFSLFQVVESTGDLAARLNMPNVERHDSCSALIKVKTKSIFLKKYIFYVDFTR
jgi:hypothetical protein